MILMISVGCVDNSNELITDEFNREFDVPTDLPTFHTVSMIGDSRFISHGGSILRKAIKKNSSNNLIFVGSLQDTYGYNHDAVGGSNSANLIARYDDIPLADIYIIMFGTNDNDLQTSINTISFIITEKLAQGSKVYYCAETPRNDHGDGNHIRRANSIAQMFQGVEGFEMIDLRTPLLNDDGTFNDELYRDHVHPNSDGGKIMGREIANKLN